jgi:helicase
MKLDKIRDKVPLKHYEILGEQNITELRPAQEKAIKAGLLDDKSLLICTPTASGKTLIAELAFVKDILEEKGKAVYVVPLKALATEKFKEFKKRYSKLFKIAISIGDHDSSDIYLDKYDLIICTAEKLDSLIRHNARFIKYISIVIIDEIHLLNDPGRGPTLEIIITMLKMLLKDLKIIGLSATIGNPKELGEWLGAKLVEDTWRPVKLDKGIHFEGKTEIFE